jgi:hypothetical protein
MLKGRFISSFNYAEVVDITAVMHDFLSLDTGVRLGIYGDAFIYIEAGFDALELFLDDRRDDENFNNSRENYAIDGYAGEGAGINTRNIRTEGFIKARQIDSDTWDSDKHIFYGRQISLFL